MGAGSFINDSAFIDRGPVVLGKNVYIGPRAVLITARHSVGSADPRAGQGAPAAVTVGAGSWIGANATVLPGVT
ncbi:sugar O-acetyltransferase, partial [Micrococcus sp. SIMBA_144]